jgi:integrase/recombinase XerD
MRLSDVIDGYWLAKRRNLSAHTVADYGLTFQRLLDFVGDVDFSGIGAPDLNAYLDHITTEYHLSPKTQLNAWIALSSLWTWAERELGAPHVIRQGVDKPRSRRPPPHPYTLDEVRRMLASCDGGQNAERDRTIVLLMLDTGLRVSELCAADVRDYDSRRGQLVIRHGKGDKQRSVYLGDTSRRQLWRYHADRQPRASDPLITTRSGKRFTRTAMRLLIVRLGRRADVDGATPHRFRHTFAISFLRNGGNLFALQEMLGHSTLEMVRSYARLADVDVAQAQRRASPADNWRV